MRATLDHFDLRVASVDRAADFFERAFGWAAPAGARADFGAGGERYLHLEAGGGSGGARVGLFAGSRDWVERSLPVVRIEDESLEESLARVTSAGGTVVAEPREVEGSGRFARFRDPDGNEWGLWSSRL